MLVFLDWTFAVSHTALILFNVFGWIHERTRVAHRICLGLTFFSWFALGYFYGFGFCICTEWHFQIRDQLGYNDTESSYIQLLLRQLLGIKITPEQSDWLVGGVTVTVLICSISVWIIDRKRKRLAI